MRLFFVCVLAVGAVATAERAEGFCWTTTTMPSTYNPTDGDCWDGGVPLHWPMSRAPYGVAAVGSPLRNITGAEATRVADLAFDAWKEASCDGGTPSVQGFDDGPIASVPEASDCTTSASCDPAAHDVIVFDDDGGPFENAGYTIALTTVSYGLDDGRIFEAKTEVNSAEFELTTGEPPQGSDAIDLQTILTHEAGHFFGLAHTPDTTAIMYFQYQPGEVLLTPDDVTGICTHYPPSGPSSGGCSFTSAQTRGDGAGVGACVAALCAGCAARRLRPWRGRHVRPYPPIRRSSAKAPAKSSGNGASNRIVFPVAGCTNPRTRAWSAGRPSASAIARIRSWLGRRP